MPLKWIVELSLKLIAVNNFEKLHQVLYAFVTMKTPARPSASLYASKKYRNRDRISQEICYCGVLVKFVSKSQILVKSDQKL